MVVYFFPLQNTANISSSALSAFPIVSENISDNHEMKNYKRNTLFMSVNQSCQDTAVRSYKKKFIPDTNYVKKTLFTKQPDYLSKQLILPTTDSLGKLSSVRPVVVVWGT